MNPDRLRARYAELREWRVWYRTTCRRLFGLRWADLEAENREQLRNVVLARWNLRRLGRAA